MITYLRTCGLLPKVYGLSCDLWYSRITFILVLLFLRCLSRSKLSLNVPGRHFVVKGSFKSFLNTEYLKIKSIVHILYIEAIWFSYREPLMLGVEFDRYPVWYRYQVPVPGTPVWKNLVWTRYRFGMVDFGHIGIGISVSYRNLV